MPADDVPAPRTDDQPGAEPEDPKARTMSRMREALEKKNSKEKGVHQDGPLREKAHGSEVSGGGPKMHRRKAGGGGA